MISIAMQLQAPIASATENHQLDIEHLQVQHSHDQDIKYLQKLVDDEGHEVTDCHHCGHCSGNHLSWTMAKALTGDLNIVSIDVIPYIYGHSSAPIEARLRPPIS